MRYWNEYDVRTQLQHASNPDRPNRLRGILVITRLMNWTNRNSDGWAYWPKPVRSASRLMELLESGDHWNSEDVTAAELRKACSPIKSFLTRQGVSHADIFGE